ncbi:MAG: MnhB domain-containing protein [Phycisphaeraceae bacterium]
MSSLILRTSMALIMPLALLFALFMAIKGHNAPGGGFIGGLIAAVALALYRMTYGAQAFRDLVPVHPRTVMAAGMALAVATAVAPLLAGLPLLHSYLADIPLPGVGPVHFASALFFDAGVFLVVVGVSVGMIVRLSEEIET